MSAYVTYIFISTGKCIPLNVVIVLIVVSTVIGRSQGFVTTALIARYRQATTLCRPKIDKPVMLKPASSISRQSLEILKNDKALSDHCHTKSLVTPLKNIPFG